MKPFSASWRSRVRRPGGPAGRADRSLRPPARRRISPLPAARRFTLANGMPVTMVPFGQVPKVAIRLVVAAANVHEGKDEIWLADLTGNLMREGTDDRERRRRRAGVRRHGWRAWHLRRPRHDLDFDRSAVRARRRRGAASSPTSPQHPRLPESELERVKGNLLRNLAIQQSSPQAIAQEKFAQLLYGEHPYGRLFPTEAIAEGLHARAGAGVPSQPLRRSRARLYVAGVFDAAAVEAAIKQAFDGWAGAKAADATCRRRRLQLGASSRCIDRADAPQSTVLLGLRVPTASHKDWIALEVTDALLGGAFGSRITTNIREQKGYTYSPFSQLEPHPGHADWVETADVTTNVTGASLKEIFFGDRSAPEGSASGGGAARHSEQPRRRLRRTECIAHRRHRAPRVRRSAQARPRLSLHLRQTRDGGDARRGSPDRQRYLTPDKMAVVVVGDEKTVKAQVTQWQ